MITDVIRAPRAPSPAAFATLRRWRTGLGDVFEAERDRWLIWVPVLLGLGVAGYFLASQEPKLSSGFLLVALSGALALGVRQRPALARAAVALTIVSCGFLAAELRTATVR